MRTPQQIADRLRWVCQHAAVALNNISEEDFSVKPLPEKWSKKEILGHLIDSAANNHQRFIRIQYEDQPVIGYDQNKWVAYSRYQEMDKSSLIQFWKLYNEHLAALILQIDPDDWQRLGKSNADRELTTLHWYADDYVTHLEHHLKAIGITIGQ